ncbi:MAG: MFS transporter [Verrucomicrobiota bacterium]
MSTSQPTCVRYQVLGFTLVLAAISYLDRVCISMAAPVMKQDLGLTDWQMSKVFSAFTLTYALFEIPSGWLADRFGPRLMLTRIVVGWSILTAATGWSTGFLSLILIRLLFGAAEAGTFPGISRVYSHWLPKPFHATAFGLAIMTGALAGGLSQPLVAKLLSLTHWKMVFSIFASFGLLWSVAWLFWFRDWPQKHPSVNDAELQLIDNDPTPHTGHFPGKAILKNPNLPWLCVMYFGVIYGWYFYLTWFPTYLMRAHQLNLQGAGLLASLPLFGIAFGVALGGWTSDRWIKKFGEDRGRRLPGLLGLPLAALSILIATRCHQGPYAATWIGIAAALGAFGVASAWSVSVMIGGKHAGVLSGTMNTFGNLGGATSPLVFGYLIQQGYSWNLPLYTVAFGYLLSAFAWSRMRLDPSLQ